jgi:hypothetical protein
MPVNMDSEAIFLEVTNQSTGKMQADEKRLYK